MTGWLEQSTHMVIGYTSTNLSAEFILIFYTITPAKIVLSLICFAVFKPSTQLETKETGFSVLSVAMVTHSETNLIDSRFSLKKNNQMYLRTSVPVLPTDPCVKGHPGESMCCSP